MAALANLRSNVAYQISGSTISTGSIFTTIGNVPTWSNQVSYSTLTGSTIGANSLALASTLTGSSIVLSGNVGIGSNSPAYTLDLGSNTIGCGAVTASTGVNTNVIASTGSSTIRLKTSDASYSTWISSAGSFPTGTQAGLFIHNVSTGTNMYSYSNIGGSGTALPLNFQALSYAWQVGSSGTSQVMVLDSTGILCNTYNNNGNNNINIQAYFAGANPAILFTAGNTATATATKRFGYVNSGGWTFEDGASTTVANINASGLSIPNGRISLLYSANNSVVICSTAYNQTATANDYSVIIGNGGTAGNGGVVTGYQNVIIGGGCGNGLTSGYFNTFVGNGAVQSGNISGYGNSIFGFQAGYLLSSGYYNSGFGFQALVNITTGINNTAVGKSSSASVTIGNENTTMGISSGPLISTGSQNVCLGVNSGLSLTSGSFNMYLGVNTQASGGSVGNEIVIGCSATNSIGKGSNTFFVASTGGSAQGNGATLWGITSDINIKTNVAPLESTLSKILALEPISYQHKEEIHNNIIKKRFGYIAQDYINVFPEHGSTYAANKFEREELGLTEVKGLVPELMPHVIKAFQEQHAIIISLQTQIAQLIERLSAAGIA